MRRLERLIWKAVDAIILFAVTGMVVLIVLQVGSRLFGHSIPWTEELSRFLFIWTIWLGLAAGFRYGQHPAVTLLSDLVRQPLLRRVLDLIPAITAALMFAIVAWHGWGLMQQQIRFGETSAILRVGMWLATLPLVLGASLAVFGALVNGAQRVLGIEDGDGI